MGHLIPAGTGYRKLLRVGLKRNVPEGVEPLAGPVKAEAEGGKAAVGLQVLRRDAASDKTAEAKRLLDL